LSKNSEEGKQISLGEFYTDVYNKFPL